MINRNYTFYNIVLGVIIIIVILCLTPAAGAQIGPAPTVTPTTIVAPAYTPMPRPQIYTVFLAIGAKP